MTCELGVNRKPMPTSEIPAVGYIDQQSSSSSPDDVPSNKEAFSSLDDLAYLVVSFSRSTCSDTQCQSFSGSFDKLSSRLIDVRQHERIRCIAVVSPKI